jgi:hypothetical protein
MSLLGGSTQNTMTLTTLPDDLRDEVLRRLFDRFGGGTDLHGGGAPCAKGRQQRG